MSKISLLLLFLLGDLTSASAQPSVQCEQILKDGAFQTYQFGSYQEMKSRTEFYYRLTEDERRESNDAWHQKLGFVYEGLPLTGEGGYRRTRAAELHRTLRDDQHTSIEQSDLDWLLVTTASPEIVSAWSQCISLNARIEMRLEALGDTNSPDDFQIILHWVPQSPYRPEFVRIAQVTVTGAEPRQERVLVSEKILRPYNGMTQVYRRTDCGPIVVTVNVDGFSPLSITLPAYRAPAPGAPVYEVQWKRRDDAGRLYHKDFTYRHTRSRGTFTEVRTHNLGESNARIYRVAYECLGQPTRDGNNTCGWSESTRGGYGPDVTTPGGGRTFTWRRRIGVHPITLIHRAYYEVSTRVCIRNCPGQGPTSSDCMSLLANRTPRGEDGNG
jgi:hypothetical protein